MSVNHFVRGSNWWRASNNSLWLQHVPWTSLQATTVNLRGHVRGVPGFFLPFFNYESCFCDYLHTLDVFGQLITTKQNWGIMHLSESCYELLVWVGVSRGTAVDTDKWQWQRDTLKLGDKHRQGRTGNLFASCNASNLYVVDACQGYTLPHHFRLAYSPSLCGNIPTQELLPSQNKLLLRNQTNLCLCCCLWKHTISSLGCIKHLPDKYAVSQRLLQSLMHNCVSAC